MLVEGEMLRNALKAHKEPPKTARVAEAPKAEAVAASDAEAPRKAAQAQIVEESKVLSQGELGL